MSESPGDRGGERRRRGPLGDDQETRETRRPAPEGEEPTRRVPYNRPERTGDAGDAGKAGDRETRVMRSGNTWGNAAGGAAGGTAGGAGPASPAGPVGYYEAVEEREALLRDIYGGVDWLASFLGFIFTLVGGAVLGLIAWLILRFPLGFSFDLGGGDLDTVQITGLAVIGALLFLAYFFGGYVAGRLARFDGGRNGVMLLLWTFFTAVLILLAGGIFSGFLPSSVSEEIQGFINGGLLSTIGNLRELGALGIGIVVAALLLAFLGGFAGGRLGSRYHSEIDRTV